MDSNQPQSERISTKRLRLLLVGRDVDQITFTKQCRLHKVESQKMFLIFSASKNDFVNIGGNNF